MMHIFYAPNIQDLILDKEESHHCARVLRLTENDPIAVVNGQGTLVEALITEISDKKTRFKIIEEKIDFNRLPYKLHLAVAPTKNINRFEWFIEKATEIGITEITPLLCENSERKVIKNDRLNKIIISAAKQSGKAYFPVLRDMISFEKFINDNKLSNSGTFIAHCREEKRIYLNDIKTLNDIIICIGPEGDFSNDEINLASQNNFISLTFGNNRFRTETAAVYVCSVISILQDLNKKSLLRYRL